MTRTSGSDGATSRVHSCDAAAGSRLCIAPLRRLCDDSKLFNCTLPHTQKWVCATTRLQRREGAVTRQSPISPQMFLQTGLGRASTRQLGQPPVGGDWVLPRYSRHPHRPTPISRNFNERFSKIQVHRESSLLKTPFAILKFCPRSWRGRLLHTLENPCFFDPMPKIKWRISGAPKNLDRRNQICKPKKSN